jgi:hypothetical protein
MGVQGEATGKTPEPDNSYIGILHEHDVSKAQHEKRKVLLEELAKPEYNDGTKSNAVIAHLSEGSLEPADIQALVNVLLHVGKVETLSVILHSPGGDGTVVERFVSVCKVQCDKFRVIIPHQAKSAATLICLGADEIIMGPTSELGPIDAQVRVSSGGIRRYISAQSFISARDDRIQQYNDLKAANKDVTPVLQMLASIDLPFTAHCESLMDFGRDVARKLLSAGMMKNLPDKKKRVNKVVRELSSVERFKVHGREVNGNTAKDEFGLNVKLLGLQDPHWKLIWQYYNRAHLACRRDSLEKFFESQHGMLGVNKQPDHEGG